MNVAKLDEMGWAMAEVYEAVTNRILINLARRFPYVQKSDELRGSFDYQARMLAQMGQVTRETVDIIAGSLDGADQALRQTLEEAIKEALKDEEPKLRKAAEQGLLTGTAAEIAPEQMQAFQLYYRQSADKLNLVNTVMLESTEAAYRATVADAASRLSSVQSFLNVGAGEVVTGVSAWNKAMHDAVQNMVSVGITGFVDHGGHKWTPEAYVAMDIRTTTFNVARGATWELNEQYGNDLYQVSSHNGARPLCYPWQRKVISSTDNAREVEDLDGDKIQVIAQSATSYGQAAGLFGVNCRHYPMTFIPGFSTLKGKPQDEEDNERVYQESQEQRKLERDLRQERAKMEVLKAQGATKEDIAKQKERVDAASDKIQAFCDKTGRARRYNREYTPVNATWPDKSTWGNVGARRGAATAPQTGGGAAGAPAEPQKPEFVQAKTIEEAEAYAKSHFLQSETRGVVSYKGIDLEYANTCNRVLTEVFDRYSPKYMLGKIAPMNAREKLFKTIIETSEAAYHWGGDGSLYINPRFYKSVKALTAHRAQIDELTETVLRHGQELIDAGKYTGARRTYLEALLRTRRQTVSYTHDFVEGTFVHESGHMLDDKIFRKVMKAIGSPLSAFNGISDSRAKYAGGISGYAVTDNQEYIAESFCAWWYGETDILDPELVRVFEEAIHFDG